MKSILIMISNKNSTVQLKNYRKYDSDVIMHAPM